MTDVPCSNGTNDHSIEEDREVIKPPISKKNPHYRNHEINPDKIKKSLLTKPAVRTLLPKLPPPTRPASVAGLSRPNVLRRPYILHPLQSRSAYWPRLQSHLLKLHSSHQPPDDLEEERKKDKTSQSSSPSILPTLVADGVDWSKVMPEGVNDTKGGFLKKLFRYFCVDLFDRLETLLIPPSMTLTRRQQFGQQRHKAVEEALCSPIHFLNATAAAYYHRTLRCNSSQTQDEDTAMLYGEVLKLLRRELHLVQPATAALLISGKTDVLNAHRSALIILVRVGGGIHNLGPMLPYALSLDRNLAITTNQAPLFSDKTLSIFANSQTSHLSKVYGAQYEALMGSSTISNEIVHYCMTTCRAIEILERSACTFDPDEVLQSTELHYLYFVRESLCDQFAHLNAEYSTGAALDRCVLMANKIVSYISLRDNYIVEIPGILAGRLYAIVALELTVADWDGHENVYRWLLFVLACMPDNCWKQQRLAADLLQSALRMKYGMYSWPSDWIEMERKNLWHYTWAESRLGGSFERVCQSLSPSVSECSIQAVCQREAPLP